MHYNSGRNFRQALEIRLRNESVKTGAPLVRLRKMVAFDRLLARLATAQPDRWVLKGGLALQLRLGLDARATKDIDLLFLTAGKNAHIFLLEASALDLGDWFQFEVAPHGKLLGGSYRFQIRSLLDERLFEQFHLDVGVGDPLFESPEVVTMLEVLAFADIPPVRFRCYPVSQHLAEKVHAYTLPRKSSPSSRVKDLVDILLLAHAGVPDNLTLHRAMQMTFDARQTHTLPDRLPAPPSNWDAPFRRLIGDTGLAFTSLQEGWEAASLFLQPALTPESRSVWHPERWQWQEEKIDPTAFA
jgi:hypothetical protein